MKVIYVASIAIFLCVGSYESKASELDRVVSSLCDYAKNDNRSAMRKKLKQLHLKLRHVYGGITCGAVDGFSGGSLLRVSTFFGSLNAAKFIATKIGKKGVASAEADGKNIMSWTESLISSGGSKATNLQDFVTYYKSKS